MANTEFVLKILEQLKEVARLIEKKDKKKALTNTRAFKNKYRQ